MICLLLLIISLIYEAFYGVSIAKNKTALYSATFLELALEAIIGVFFVKHEGNNGE